MATERQDLTPQQMRVFRAVVQFSRQKGRMPTLSEAAGVAGLVKANTYFHLKRIEARGWLTRSRNRWNIPGLRQVVEYTDDPEGDRLAALMRRLDSEEGRRGFHD